MFPKAAAGSKNATGTPGTGRGVRFGRFTSRVRGLPEVYGELPAAALAEEIGTPGDGRIRALVTVAGNPVLSTPNAGRLRRGARRARLHGERRHLPERDDAPRQRGLAGALRAHTLALRRGALPARGAERRQLLAGRSTRSLPAELDEWEILLKIGGIASGMGPNADVNALDDFLIAQVVGARGGDPRLARRGSERRRADRRARRAPGSGSRARLPLAERPVRRRLRSTRRWAQPRRSRTPPARRRSRSRSSRASPRCSARRAARSSSRRHRSSPTSRASRPTLQRTREALVLVGRRTLRSNNSWMHNLDVLVKGRPICTLHVHPDDARRFGLADGGAARVRSRVGALEIPVEMTDGIMPGVVSIPHGWGHDDPASALTVARGACRRQLQSTCRRRRARPALRECRVERHPRVGRAGRPRADPEGPSTASPLYLHVSLLGAVVHDGTSGG